MGAPELLTSLRSRGLALAVNGQNIIVKPRSALTDELRALIRQHKPELLAALQQPVDHWLVHRGGRAEDAFTSEPITSAEAATRFRASSAEPVQDNRRPATREEAEELRRLVDLVADFHAFTPGQRAEALEIALADPETSLECFRALVAELRANDELRV